MKFDFCIGNPPYQEGHKQLYPDFYKSAQEISNCVEMIFPSAWQEPKNANNLRTLNNKETKEDKQIVLINNVHNAFNGITGADWTNIILWKKGYDNGLNGEQLVYTNGLNPQKKLLLVDKKQVELAPILTDIKNKVVSNDFHSLVGIMYLQNKYNLATMLQEHPECETQISCGKDKRIRSNAFDKVTLFLDIETMNSIKIYGLSKFKRLYKYIDLKYIEPNEATYKYKILMPVASSSGVFGSVLSPFEVCEPNIGYTETFMAIGAFDEKHEADNCFKYLKTKFVRTMLGILKTNQNGKREVWKYVPIQDFTENSDIDWSKPVAEIDQQLYKKYGLSNEEIDFIETHVKEME